MAAGQSKALFCIATRIQYGEGGREKDPAKAILNKAIGFKENLLIDEAQWRLALVYVMEKDYNAAKNLLNELQYLPGYQSKAKELLQALSN